MTARIYPMLLALDESAGFPVYLKHPLLVADDETGTPIIEYHRTGAHEATLTRALLHVPRVLAEEEMAFILANVPKRQAEHQILREILAWPGRDHGVVNMSFRKIASYALDAGYTPEHRFVGEPWHLILDAVTLEYQWVNHRFPSRSNDQANRYLCADGGAICGRCAEHNADQCTDLHQTNPQWTVIGVARLEYGDDPRCDHCENRFGGGV